jgi:cytoskeletal protein CcmA (bactofilin family)
MSLIVAFLSATLVVVNTKEEHLKYTLHEFKDHTGKVQVSLSNAGEGTFSGPLISHSGTCGVQQIRVDGNATFFEDVIVPSGEARARSVIVYHQLMARETSTVEFYGKVTFGGVAPAAIALPQKPQQHQHYHHHHHYPHHHHHLPHHHHHHHHHHQHNDWEHQQHRQKQTPDVHFINGWKSSGNVQVEGSVDTTSAKVKDSLVVGTFLKAGNKVEAPEIIATDLIQGKSMQVLETLEVKGKTIMYQPIMAKSDICTGKNLQVNGTASLHSLVSLSKAMFEDDINIKGSATAVKLLKSQGECIVEGGMYVGGEAKFRATVTVNELQVSSNTSVGENLR